MQTIARDEIVAQHVADLHRQAAKQRLLRELRASRKPTVHRRRIWERLTIRRPRPAVMDFADQLARDATPIRPDNIERLRVRAALTVGRAPQLSDRPTALPAEREAS